MSLNRALMLAAISCIPSVQIPHIPLAPEARQIKNNPRKGYIRGNPVQRDLSRKRGKKGKRR